ncbi:hypothetical protein JCM1841_005190 [Sporobolomyces salmonicolor]
MTAETHRVLSNTPLNSEPPLDRLISSFFTPTELAFNRNHGEFLTESASSYKLSLSSEVAGVPSGKVLSLNDLKAFPKHEVIAVLACAGNRRIEMDEEKEVEGLKWGGSAICNAHFSGPLLREVLESADIALEETLRARNRSGELHLHFETTQNCEDDRFYGSSLPLEMALDPERPVMLAYEMNGEPLTEAHGFPLRLVAPGIIGARSVKWLERIILRDHESDNFYMAKDYKVLPPQATPETKAQYLEKVSPMMEFPLNSEICQPTEHAVVDVKIPNPTVEVKGYAMGSKGTPIAAVYVTLVPLPIASSPPAPTSHSASPGAELTSRELPRIRLAAAALAPSAWTTAQLVHRPPGAHGDVGEEGKNWGWTLWSAAVPVPAEALQFAELGVGGQGAGVAIVAYAQDVDGNKQELQTQWNLRGIAEASWSVSRIKIRKAPVA